MVNPVCELFGIEYPVVMGGVSRTPELGVAVSEAGGLGCIQGISPPDFLREQIRKYRDSTDKPFSVNFPIVLTPPEHLEAKMQMMIDEKVPVVISSAGNPKLFTKFLREGGVKVAHVLPTLYHARKAAAAGVDAIIFGRPYDEPSPRSAGMSHFPRRSKMKARATSARAKLSSRCPQTGWGRFMPPASARKPSGKISLLQGKAPSRSARPAAGTRPTTSRSCFERLMGLALL